MESIISRSETFFPFKILPDAHNKFRFNCAINVIAPEYLSCLRCTMNVRSEEYSNDRIAQSELSPNRRTCAADLVSNYGLTTCNPNLRNGILDSKRLIQGYLGYWKRGISVNSFVRKDSKKLLANTSMVLCFSVNRSSLDLTIDT